MDEVKAKQLLDKYLDETCTEEEKNILERFYLEESGRRNLPVDFIDFTKVGTEILSNVLEKTHVPVRVRQLYTWKRIAVAAAVILIILSPIVYFHIKNTSVKNLRSATAIDIKPGANKAYLTLSNGSKINLNDVSDGEIADQTGTKVNKTRNGQVSYIVTSHDSLQREAAERNGKIQFNTISTPRGGQYLVVLPDQSKVWLNASSSIKFPTAFTGDERNVSLTGEAYFEVTKNKKKPFIVAINNIEKIRVLGTHFNIMAYDDENKIATTLLEGSVKVINKSGRALLKPGQKAIFNKVSGNVEVSPADLEEAIAWKNGYFAFNNEDLQSVMRKISRWYDVDIQYKGDLSNKNFTGVISRFENASKVLEMLQITGTVHFKIDERRIIVMP